MEHAFSILMFFFSGALLLYASLMAATKDYRLLPYQARQSVKPKDPKRYTVRLARVIALVAFAPALSGLVGLWSPMAAFAVLIVSAVVFIRIGVKNMDGVE